MLVILASFFFPFLSFPPTNTISRFPQTTVTQRSWFKAGVSFFSRPSWTEFTQGAVVVVREAFQPNWPACDRFRRLFRQPATRVVILSPRSSHSQRGQKPFPTEEVTKMKLPNRTGPAALLLLAGDRCWPLAGAAGLHRLGKARPLATLAGDAGDMRCAGSSATWSVLRPPRSFDNESNPTQSKKTRKLSEVASSHHTLSL